MKNKYIGGSITGHIDESFNDPEFKKQYSRSKMISEIAQKVYELRIGSGLSQKEIAEKANTTQPVIARLEGGKDKRVPSIELLNKIASAANTSLKISFG